MNQFVTIAVFTYPHEYSVLRLLFEQAELRFFFQNETAIGLVPFYSHALGGILLKVHPDDIQLAKEIIDSFNASSSPLRIV